MTTFKTGDGVRLREFKDKLSDFSRDRAVLAMEAGAIGTVLTVSDLLGGTSTVDVDVDGHTVTLWSQWLEKAS